DKKLRGQLKVLLDSFHGTAGVYVRNLRTGKEAAINADTVFPTASIIKLPILVGIFNKIEQGEYTYHQPLVYQDSISRGGSGLMQYFKDTTKIDLRTAIVLMITHSDNTAAVWCEKLAGGGVAINSWLADHGFEFTRVNARTPGREANRELYGWGQTTPREMAELLLMIREGKAVSPAASERMYRIMTQVFWDEYALSQIPPYVQAASKQGMVDDSRSEAVLVNAPHGDYVFYIATKNNKDQRWEPDNEAWQLARKVSALLWNYFEPHSGWKPAVGVEKYFH
ncbi:MAG: serine hydrolase, partial [Bacteroidota bacterium]|nr:serine hydrolase [Bacteroidota bacterium]